MESITLRKKKNAELIERISSEFEGMIASGIKMVGTGIAMIVVGFVGLAILQTLFA